jgi:hypothetical protein
MYSMEYGVLLGDAINVCDAGKKSIGNGIDRIGGSDG